MTARSNHGIELFGDATEHQLFLQMLGATVRRSGWTCLSYCLMPNHIHLLVTLRAPTLSSGMQKLCTTWARRYNDRRRRYGHVFQGRFASRVVNDTPHLLEAMRYIALNPVRAGLCSQPTEYPWSAHPALLGLQPPRFLSQDEALAFFGSTSRGARETYRAFVADREAATAFARSIERQHGRARPDPDRLLDLARCRDPDAVVLTAHDELGFSFAAIARELGWSRWKVARRYARLTGAGAPLGA